MQNVIYSFLATMLHLAGVGPYSKGGVVTCYQNVGSVAITVITGYKRDFREKYRD